LNDAMKRRNKTLLIHSNIFLLYLLLTLILTYPVILNFSTNTAGDGLDAWMYVWDFWWVKKAIFDPYLNVYHTDYIFYPTGTSLAFHTLALFESIISIPLQSFLNLITIYNIFFILSFLIAAFGMFLLVDYLTKDKKIAFISGIAFTFAPYHFARGLGHLNMMEYGWIAFFVLFLFKTLNERKMKNPILAGIFLSIIFLTCFYYTIDSIIFTCIFLLYNFLQNRKKIMRIGFIKRFTLMIIIFLLLVIPSSIPRLTEWFSIQEYMKKEIEYSISTLIKPHNYIVPNPFNPIFGNFFKEYFRVDSELGSYYTFASSVVFVGYTILLMSMFYIIKNPKKSIFWISTVVLFFILSLGESELYLLFYNYFPFFSILRDSAQFSIMVMLSLVVLFAFGLKYILKKFKFIRKDLILYSITALVIFEFLSIPFETSGTYSLEFYKKLAQDDGDYTILDIPIHVTDFQIYMYFQTIHGKKIIGGNIARIQPYTEEFLATTPFIKEVHRTINRDYFDNWDQQKSEELYNVLKEYNIKYLIIHKRFIPEDIRTEFTEGIEEFFSKIDYLEKYYDDEFIHVYLVKNNLD